MSKGKVKWFNSTRGFGFIEPDEGGDDAFVHITAVHEAGLKELIEGQQVEYELLPSKTGKNCAMNIKVIED
jgi:CspA family cold shock protein